MAMVAVVASRSSPAVRLPLRSGKSDGGYWMDFMRRVRRRLAGPAHEGWDRLQRVLKPRFERVDAEERIPADIAKHLNSSNPYLVDLTKRYEALGRFEHSTWKKHVRRIDLHRFRGEGDYLSQLRHGTRRSKYLVSAAYAEGVDDWGMLRTLKEDSLFGALTFRLADDVVLSRDLIDSVLEIDFLRRCLSLARDGAYTGLDIGAGYGRFAHRFCTMFPKSYMYCIDGVATSTFLCDAYIRFRNLSDKACSVPLDEVERLRASTFDFAMNVHSWSECTLATIEYWLGLLADMNVRHLFIVPHEPSFLTMESDGSTRTYLPTLESHGYRCVLSRKKFGDSRFLDKYGLYNAPYSLFERKA
jgi:hypothetical protein